MISREIYLRMISVSVIVLMLLSGLGLYVNAEAEEPDSDFDGLSDRYEEAIGTDPMNPDTDADGIPDADDPTPKGGMFNTEEVWDTWDIEGYIDKPALMSSETFNVSFNVSNLLPDGTVVIPTSIDAVLYIYDTRSYYTLMQVEKRQITVRNGSCSFTHTAAEPGKYYFGLGINASQITLGKHATSYEFGRLKREMKMGYVQGAAYPPFYTTVRSIYPTLLPGHSAKYFIERYAYAPVNGSHDFLAAFARGFDPRPVLGSLYEPRAGAAHIYLFRNSLLNKTSVFVPVEGRFYNITLNGEGRYNLAVTAYETEIAWDYAYSQKFPYSTAYIKIINPTVSWIDLSTSNPYVYENVSIGLHKYSITTTMNESAFSDWYSRGGLRYIATEYPEHASPYQTEVWISLFYYVQAGRDRLAHTYFDRKITLDGDAYTSWKLNLPGRYLAAAFYGPQQPFHPQGNFPLYQQYGYHISSHYHDLQYFHCNTDVYLSAFRSSNVYFSNEGVNVSVTGTKGASSLAGWDISVYLDSQYKKIVTFDDFDESVNLGQPAKGKHTFHAIALFSPSTRTIVESLGVRNFPYNWVGRTSFQVKNFLLYVKAPNTMVLGHPANMSVLVYGAGVKPVENASITVRMDGYNVNTRTVATGRTGADGTARITFEHPGGNYYELFVIASKGGMSERVDSYSRDRRESYTGYIHTNKPVYLPGDTVYAQFSLMDVDNEAPLAGEVEVRLRYNGNGKDIMRFSLELDDYGMASTEFPISKDAPWGTYGINLYQGGRHLLSRDVGVRYYETPDTRIVFDPELSLRAGEISIPVKVEYMFGAPVYQGEVSFSLEGYENRYEYNYWDWWYGDYDSDCEGMWGGWWYNPGPVYEEIINVTVENGWANITVEVPKGLERLSVDATFSDEFDHSCKADITYYLGEAPDPDMMTGIGITPAKEPFTAADDPTFRVHTYAYKEIGTDEGGVEEDVLGDVSTDIVINVTSYDEYGTRQDEALLNLTTDIHGIVELNLNRLGVDTFNLTAAGRYYFKMEITVASEDVPPATIEYEFFVHSVVFSVKTDPAVFTPDTNATITLEAESLVPTVNVLYNYTLSVFKRERYTGYDYYNYYYVNDGAPIFATSGRPVGPVNVTWKLPEHIDSGRYVIRVIFENGMYEKTIDHPVEVVEKVPLQITLSPSSNNFLPGDNINIDVDLSEPFKGQLYLWASTGCDIITKSISIDGVTARFAIATRDWHHGIDISVFLVDEKARMVSSSARIEYDIGPLSVVLDMNRSGYEPGDAAQLTATVLTSGGEPVEGAQLSLSIVDASVFELFDDRSAAPYYDALVTPWEFEWSYRFAMNWYSDTWYPELLPSETISYWPSYVPWTYDDGAEYDGDSDGMSGGAGQGNGMEDEAPKDANLDDALQSELDSTNVREWFTDTALWLPSVITDTDGRAIINLTLPDNICKWRIRGTARTKGLVGGEELAYFNVSKDFFIEPKLPYKMTQDDEIEMKVLLYNFHETPIEVELGVSADNWIKVFGEVQVRVKIPANSIAEHHYRMKIFGAMTNNLTFIASDFKSSTDAVRKEVFVKPNGALLVSHATGVADPVVTEILEFREELINGTQKTILRLAPGYQGLLKMGYSMLSGYPYDCTEQITSRMIPAVLYREYLKETGELNPWADRHLSRKIYIELQSLLAKQHPDGGWGWWKGDDSSLWMSGWVLLGLSTARDADFFVDPQAIADCQDFLMMRIGEDGTWMPGPADDMDDVALTAFLYFSLTRSGIPAPQPTEQVLQRIMQDGTFTPYGLSLYGLGDAEFGGQLIPPIMGSLSDMKIGSHFESNAALGGQTECTAWVLYLAAIANDDPALIRELLEWLNSRRLSSGDFGTTTATVAYMFAVLEVLKNAQPIDMDITVTVNGVRVAKEHVNDRTYRNFYNKLDAIDITEYLNTDGPNNITVSKQGTGELFYELTTVEYLRKDVAVNFPTNLSINRGDILSFELTVDPVNSRNVKVMDLDVAVRTGQKLICLNSSSDSPAEPDSSKTFTFNFLGVAAGTAKISPIIVNYKLGAGQRESGLITKYYGPVTVKINDIPTRGTGTRGLSGSSVPVKLEKSADAFAMRTQHEMNITLKVSIQGTEEQREGMGTLSIKDYLSDSLSLVNVELAEGNCVEFAVDPSKDYQEFTYMVSCPEEYQGDLGTAVLMAGEELLSYAEGSEITVSSSDYFIQRSYSDSGVELFSPLTVMIRAWSDDSIRFVAVEDYICPGFKVDERSLEAIVEDSNGNVLSYEISDDHVTFFISSLGELEMEYEVVPMLPGRFVSPPALVFPMYSPDDTVQSDSHRITVNPRNSQWGLKYVEDPLIEEPEDDDDNDTDEPGDDDDVIEPEKPDIPVDVNLPDGPGDGDPEPVEEDDDTESPLPDDDDADDDDGATGQGDGVEDKTGLRSVISVIIVLSALILMIAVLMLLKRSRRKKWDASKAAVDEPEASDPAQNESKKTSQVIVRKRVVKKDPVNAGKSEDEKAEVVTGEEPEIDTQDSM